MAIGPFSTYSLPWADPLIYEIDTPTYKKTINGVEFYYKNGFLHREDGPALISLHGDEIIHSWWYNGEWLSKINSQEEFERWLNLRAFL